MNFEEDGTATGNEKYDSNGYNDYGQSIINTFENNYVMTGNFETSPSQDYLHVLKVSADAVTVPIWDYTYTDRIILQSVGTYCTF